MLFRMVRIQPPIDVMRIVAAGSTACCSTLPTNAGVNAGCSPLS
jgi:hypothetical protein